MSCSRHACMVHAYQGARKGHGKKDRQMLLQEKKAVKATHEIGGFAHKVHSLVSATSFDEVQCSCSPLLAHLSAAKICS